jgi:hypothetical protein
MMTRITESIVLALLLSALMTPLATHASTYTAASCNQSDVNALINGPTHTAANGDTIVIPAGTCTWSSGLSITTGITLMGSGTPNTGAGTFGSGTLNTVIIDNAGSSNALIGVTGLPYGQTFILGLLDIEPASPSTALVSPIQIAGACTSNGCPNTRIHNIGFGLKTPWTESGNGAPANWMIRTDNVFGVIDHNTIPTGNSVVLFTANLTAYLGVGAYGDNSWAQPDSFGTNNVLYAENNSLYVTLVVSECETGPAGGGVGGCRIAGRFNQINMTANSDVAFSFHGLDTDGRPQGGRQLEVYGNTIKCTGGSCAGGAAGFRSGTGFVFSNSLNAANGAWFNNIADITVYRTVFSAGGGWGACGGSSPYDSNDGVVYYSGTTSSSGTTLTDSSKSWTTNQFIPAGAPYSVYDMTQGWWAEIIGNTATTLTIAPSIPEENNLFNNRDSYEILRATVCADQGGRGRGNFVSGAAPSPASSLSQTSDPIYEFSNTVTGSLTMGHFGTDTGRTIANRDWFTDNGGGEQTSPSSPFNGASGVGWGPIANRPSTCEPHVGYWATDQGNWNQSGNGGQGELFVCTATNQWTLYYTPYTYPHPLTQGTGVTANAPGPPTGLKATVQ